ncbi:MAG TPA: ribosomal protein S18-alanine N-acetyltransferase [Candidatus Binataceae bacterium]|nr:ribosomal protein S18-alanine N-acetyltransferase [Candidatus Binataceae bacterium]
MTTNVREATVRDLARILEIERLAFAQPWSLDSFKRELMLPFSRIMVAAQVQTMQPVQAETRGQPVGFLCRWLVADECHILNVAVHPELRRSGIAMALMAEAIDEAKAKNIRLVTLEVRRSNVAARSLYRKLNFEERRLRTNYYGPGEDAIVMELHLGGAHRIHR